MQSVTSPPAAGKPGRNGHLDSPLNGDGASVNAKPLNPTAEKIMTLIQLSPHRGLDAIRELCNTRIAEHKHRQAEGSPAPGANGKLPQQRKSKSPRGASSSTAPLLSANTTDAGNAQRFIHLHGADLRYCHQWRKWLAWNGQHWREDDTGEVDRRAKATITETFRRASTRAAELAGDKKAAGEMNELADFALRCESANRLAAMVRLAQSEQGVPVLPAALDADHWKLNCPNGTVDLYTGKLLPHSREDYLTVICPTDYDPAATCPAWLRFLEDVFPANDMAERNELADYLQRFLGYCLTGDVREQILTIFWGSGANGKSTLLETVCTVMGPYASPAPDGLLLARRGEQHPAELADLFGKRLVHSTETGEGARLNEARVKKLTGGDSITARRMRENFWSFQPTHKLILCTNHRPKITGRDHAIRRRLRLVPFTRRFADAEQDDTLKAKLRAEAAGILAWIVRGCLDWQRDGLPSPRAVTEATAEYIAAEDILAAWIGECCTTSPHGDSIKASLTDLYESYRKWAERSGERFTMTARQLAATLREEGYEDYRNNGPWFRGIAPNQTERTDGLTD